MFKTSQANIPQIKAVIKKYGSCFFHGCGNIYIKKEDSNFRQNFTNPAGEYSTYRIEFTSLAQVPDTVEELDKLLLTSRNQEMIREKMNKVSRGVDTIEVEEDEEIYSNNNTANAASKTAEELEFERLLAEENANKGK